MANRGLMAECKELLRTLPDLERLLKKYELNLGASWVERICQTHAWRKTKKTKGTLSKPQHKLTKQSETMTGSYTDVNPKFLALDTFKLSKWRITGGPDCQTPKAETVMGKGDPRGKREWEQWEYAVYRCWGPEWGGRGGVEYLTRNKYDKTSQLF